jgi:hypothetical protein
MLLIDAKEKYYLKEIARLLSGKTSEVLGAPEGTGAKSVDLGEIKKRIDGAEHDEPRVMRALDRMVHAGALEKSGFRWSTTPRFNAFCKELYD